MDAIAQMYENKLRLANKTAAEKLEQQDDQGQVEEPVISYDVRGLVTFLEQDFSDLSCLVFDETQKIYVPHGKDWIKSRIYMYIKKYATKETE